MQKTYTISFDKFVNGSWKEITTVATDEGMAIFQAMEAIRSRTVANPIPEVIIKQGANHLYTIRAHDEENGRIEFIVCEK